MPWLWEVLDAFPPVSRYDWNRLFSTVLANELAGNFWSIKDEELADTLYTLLDSDDSVFGECHQSQDVKFATEAKALLDRHQKEADEKIASGLWPSREDPGLRGLRNRKRVWNDIEEIIRRIKNLNGSTILES
ncbi:Uu.00g122280.m01.CDS01 [Anthostomella pinea]|uniref:Uu.00g122280.m01.CDS01 n=1 Tax=Anthostomella pinea TaxID=933095 RepID=A0AAI8VH33_9PEZI|nr:Uu.00g122280.m01.CDS01 [Anthostomella pinea]